ATGGIGFITTLVVGGWGLGPVRRLAQEARKLQKEDLDQQIFVATNDELGVLADVLNSLTGERRQDREELEHLGGLLQDKAKRVAELEAVIGELPHRERKMQESEQRNRLVARALKCGVFEWDLHTDEVRWDDTCLELLGLPQKQSTSTFEVFLQMVHPEDRQRIREAVANHLEHKEQFDEEYRIRHAEGHHLCVVSRMQTERSTAPEAPLVAGIICAGTNAKAPDRLELEDELRRAIEREEFVVHYQPKVMLDDLRVFALEALVRWDHPHRGLIPPDEFIPLAEETDLILPLGEWVLRQACGQMKVWQAKHPGKPPLMVSVNLSPRQFRQPDLGESIARVLLEAGLDPGCLVLEVTESALMEDSHAAGMTLQRLSSLGVSIAIDDFGTAYSSLARLKNLPIDILKVDRSFVAGLGEDEEDEVLVSGILSMASGLGLSVVAEGVETSKQLARLRALGCSRAQGYYFSRPLPSEAATSLLERHLDP
ncbi:MAG: EAL domain-containing protein, partial [Pyrinomonadaceae bacterium]|nr:EAL domain-containing protein [Pyrinomonadaceae bacterium]